MGTKHIFLNRYTIQGQLHHSNTKLNGVISIFLHNSNFLQQYKKIWIKVELKLENQLHQRTYLNTILNNLVIEWRNVSGPWNIREQKNEIYLSSTTAVYKLYWWTHEFQFFTYHSFKRNKMESDYCVHTGDTLKNLCNPYCDVCIHAWNTNN